jgi:F-type H+-transporting ATPase subunit a
MKMKLLLKIVYLWAVLMIAPVAMANAPAQDSVQHKAPQKEFNIKEFILEHLADSYTWHITKVGENEISVPLPVIVYSNTTGWHTFLSSKFHENEAYEGLKISEEESTKGKIVEVATGKRPMIDISLTKVATALLLGSLLLIVIVMYTARSYKKDALAARGGLAGFIELFVMNVVDDVIKPCVGKDYKKFTPYLLTVFFFIFTNNILGLIPIFPGGANVTGNIAITFVLAICTFLIVNFSGSKEYWREIFWPEVPTWLKVPIPLMPAIEVVGILTKPFALMIRLFANILAGHSITLGLTCLVFVTVKLGVTMNVSMSAVSVLLSIFINLVELLVAYIQAYVFTMLSALFIGLARIEPHHEAHKENHN